MDISGLSGYSDNLSAMARQMAAQQNLEKLQGAIKSASKTSKDGVENPELMDACKKFEAYFLEQVFKEMEKTVPEHDYGDTAANNLVGFFKDSAIQTLAEDVTNGQQSFGLAQQLYEQMVRNASPTIVPDE